MRWSDIPIPEGHLFFLTLGLGLHRRFHWPLRRTARPARGLGRLLLLLGALGAGWAMWALRAVDLSRPAHLVDSGPYRLSRNPIYVGWTLIYLGGMLLANTRWLLLLLPALLVHLHFAVVVPEEQALEHTLGAEYRRYRDRVRRYC